MAQLEFDLGTRRWNGAFALQCAGLELYVRQQMKIDSEYYAFKVYFQSLLELIFVYIPLSVWLASICDQLMAASCHLSAL